MKIFTSQTTEPYSWTLTKLLVNLKNTLLMFPKTFLKISEKERNSFKIISKIKACFKKKQNQVKNSYSYTFSYSINQGIFPNNFIIALIHPIHKGRSKLIFSVSPYLFYPYLAKCMKNLCIRDYMNFLQETKLYIIVSLVFKKLNRLN